MQLWKRDWKKEAKSKRQPSRQWLQAAVGLSGLLGLALGFAWQVLERPLSYIEAFGALVIGYRLMERGLDTRYWPLLLLPGIVLAFYLSINTDGWQQFVLILGIVWLVELVYLQLRHRYNRTFVQSLAVGQLHLLSWYIFSCAIAAITCGGSV